MTRKKLAYVALALLVVAFVVAGCTSPGTEVAPKSQPSAAPAAVPAVQQAGDAGAPVKLIAYYPMNPSHKPIGDYVLTLPKKFGEDKVYAEVYDMEQPDGQKKWSTSGLSCAGVFVNGKNTWDVTRAGKPEKVNFIKRMGSFWQSDDLEAVIKSQLADPKKTPEVPKNPKSVLSDEAGGAEAAATPASAKPETAPAGKGK